MGTEDMSQYDHVVEALGSELKVLAEVVRRAAGSIEYSSKIDAYDVLTEMDVMVEDRIREKLKGLTPTIPVVGEERGGDRSARLHWLIDPIDGTIHFVRGNPFYCTMIALVEDGVPIVGVIYNLATDEFFSAVRGQGAKLNGVPTSVSKRLPREAMLQTEINLKVEGNLNAHKELTLAYSRILNVFAPGYEFAMIAAGKAEARVCLNPFGKDYDFAAGVIIIREAGGVAKNVNGSEYVLDDERFIVASSNEIYADIVSKI